MLEPSQTYFHFTLGPVQSFVAQARRTRDFWAGSFLLSWLAGVAMAEVRRQGGTIDFPCPPEGYLDWVVGQADAQKSPPPRQGAIPNRFKSVCARVPAGFVPQQVVQAVQAAWVALANHVWDQDQLDQVAAETTRSIWDRQHGNFWEVSWVLSDSAEETGLLDQRKNWRTHGFGLNEPGPKCMMMDGWQELSGEPRPGPQAQRFWKQWRHASAPGLKTDLGEKEQLCGLAYVKRRFARHFATFETTLPGTGLALKGWRLSHGMPSVAYMAAVHWLEAVLKQGNDDEVAALLTRAQDVDDERPEWDTDIACLTNAAPTWQPQDPRRRLLALDGNLFFRHVQEQPQAYGYDPARVAALKTEVKAFRDKHPELPAAPSPFYAVLMMDGDSLGAQMSQREQQKPIAASLERFTRGVPELVKECNGFLIYAGGDDVLALLPLEDALRCAAAVRRHYLNCFAGTQISTTISAAVAYAHVKTPLAQVLSDVHGLLDDVAKDGAGRDAVAVRVWKTGGCVLQWAQPWELALTKGGTNGDLEVEVERLARLFSLDESMPAAGGPPAPGTNEADLRGRFSSKFFFKIEERIAVLRPSKSPGDPRPRSGTDQGSPDADLLQHLLAVDFWASDKNREKVSLEIAGNQIKALLTQCQPAQREVGKPAHAWRRGPLAADGALLVRFLATQGMEEGGTA